jgi:hypothetical protein
MDRLEGMKETENTGGPVSASAEYRRALEEAHDIEIDESLSGDATGHTGRESLGAEDDPDTADIDERAEERDTERIDSAISSEEMKEGEKDDPSDGNGSEVDSKAPIDYKKVMREDLEELKGGFRELEGISSITELPNPLRYAALRDLGLTATEAYLATSGRRTKDNRSHLSSAVPASAGAPRSNMTRSELEGARELFPDLKDGELIGLYKKVNF